MTNGAKRYVVPAFGAVITALVSGCLVVPVPAPTRTSAPPEVKRIDLSFIHPGITTRDEIQEKLAWSDVGFRSELAFVGRWSKSSSATFWMIGGGGPQGVGTGAAGGGRNWTAKTLLVNFDEKGIVSSWRFVPDRDLETTFKQLANREAVPRRFEPALRLSVDHRHNSGGQRFPATLTLEEGTLKFSDGNGHDFEIARTKVSGVSVPRMLKSDQATPDELRFTMEFSEKTKAGNKITLFGSANDFLTLVYYETQIERVLKR